MVNKDLENNTDLIDVSKTNNQNITNLHIIHILLLFIILDDRARRKRKIIFIY